MVDKFADASSHELEVLLESLFENVAKTPTAIPGVFKGYDPVTGHLFIAGEDRSALRFLVCKALVAAARFSQDRPSGWPELPLRDETIGAMINCDNVKCNVTGLFGDSLRGEGWSPGHPSFSPFVSGLMFDKHTPIAIRRDPELQREFPPCRLKGMTGGTWQSPETLRLDRLNRRRVAEHEAAGL